FQIQPNARTIQEVIEQALTRIHKNQPVRIHSSGRTDKGVHAIGQVFHFESTLQMKTTNWKKALNALLPADIYISQVEEVEADFHARISAQMKEYHYIVHQTEERD